MDSKIELFLMRPNGRPKGWKKHFGYYAIADDGTIYLPGDMFSKAAFFAASWDGEPIVLAQDGKTALFRSEWLKGEYPQSATDIENVEAKIREGLSNHLSSV
jgi:hypothetical protein